MSNVENIFAAGGRLFARYGFEGVTMRDVADASGVTLATVYYHFKTKEELHDEVSQYQFEEFFESILQEQAKTPELQHTPSQLMGVIFDAVLANPTLFYMIQRDLLHFDAGVRHVRSRKRYAEFVALIKRTLTTARGAEADYSDVFALAALITGYCELVQADEGVLASDRPQFIATQRAGMVRLVRQMFDAPG